MSDSIQEIAADSKVSMHFALRTEGVATDGTRTKDEVDSTFNTKPAEFVLGDGNLLPGFEEFLIGLTAGDHKTFMVPAEKAFGQTNPQNVQEMKRSSFAGDMPLSPGLVVSFADAAKAELPGVIKSIEQDYVIVDFNHPLAGKNLEFEVQILTVET
ncbi:MAG: FKBP-type peptidyl-prolyl cis-trans isomerase SlpA [Oleispira sp.]|jgi:FKBP-type peptidyl-prolyl cis-trans isomerase SlpA